MEYNKINQYLVDIFNRILVIEEMSLKTSQFNDVSLKEMHTIEIIGKYQQVTPSDIARELMVTLGTVTTSLNKLELKGYIERTRSSVDRRVVYLSLTKKGRLLDRLHARFHKNMVGHVVADMNEDEMQALLRGLGNLHQFLEDLV
ncbi:MarR family transcriptional regulator [Streptococcus equi subsp. zooepidemicus Sz35]|uniref:Transcriptional regulator, MarR family n=1 Tax=Streptococcus equi subsp. zooepidemicus TaxID=40041 RepID=A0A6D2LRB4_STRSZ|nr:MarR family transcriptional regulator [Streptococcus equi]AEJ24625.1 transcriptional regulator of fatty acid biosynthesis FabT [Streptococcus equi subsp. zooepidemicus ATCC 35246]AIA68031.1 MarR family transcriptional regulator [Streptococcus equi subsp. zooepidemicus CY]KIS21193.1 MarR family transcriptional regulator [Streptococcus equi subsp. zooepidemicus Sz35]MBR7683052.1 MarR family transcriptional regulator [Streptococcus equi subsp. zooepidemicus]MBR7752523.1 MarR family transcripti